VDFLVADPTARSNTSVCLKVVDSRVTSLPAEAQAQFAKALADTLEKQAVALDAASYRSAPPGLRLWCGATIERSDVEAVLPWLDWAFATCVRNLSN
jgi:phosphoserine aminotransferase